MLRGRGTRRQKTCVTLKKTCVTLNDVFEKVNAAHLREDWREVLKWEGRIEDMMENQADAACNDILVVFVVAHMGAFNSTGSEDNLLSFVRLETRQVEVLGKMQRFRDQGETHSAMSPTNSLFSTSARKRRRTSSGHGRLQKRTDSSR